MNFAPLVGGGGGGGGAGLCEKVHFGNNYDKIFNRPPKKVNKTFKVSATRRGDIPVVGVSESKVNIYDLQ